MKPSLAGPFKATVATIALISGLILTNTVFAAPIDVAPAAEGVNLAGS